MSVTALTSLILVRLVLTTLAWLCGTMFLLWRRYQRRCCLEDVVGIHLRARAQHGEDLPDDLPLPR
jgi:hypothetical protein